MFSDLEDKKPLRIMFQKYGFLNPAHDITALEAAHLCMLVATAMNPESYWFDLNSFVKEKGLERHFIKEEK